jgi:hypothetical protein
VKPVHFKLETNKVMCSMKREAKLILPHNCWTKPVLQEEGMRFPAPGLNSAVLITQEDNISGTVAGDSREARKVKVAFINCNVPPEVNV